MKNLLFTLIAVLSFSFGKGQTNYQPILTSLMQNSENNFENVLAEKLSVQGYVTTYDSKIKFGIGKEFIDKMPKNTLGNIFTLVSTGKSTEELEVQVIDFVKKNLIGSQYSINLDMDEKTGYYSLIVIRTNTASMFLQVEKKFDAALKADQYQFKMYGKN